MYPSPAKRFAASIAALTVALSVVLGACGGGATQSPEKKYVIGSLIWNTSIPFYSNFIKGQQEEAQKLGVTLDLQNGNNDLNTQVAVIQQFITKKVDAILVTPSDAKGIVPAIKQANAAGIPVFAVNNKVGEGADVVSFIGADDYMFGQKQGELLVKAVGENGKVGLVMGALGTSAQLLRKQGLTDYLKNHTGIQIVVEQTAEWDNAKALAVVQDWLSKYPKGQLDAIIDQGPEGAMAAKWAKDNGRPEIKFLMGDYPADVRTGIQQGYVYGTVDQDPKPQGVRGVEAAYQWLTGAKDKVVRPNDYLALPIVTKDNVEQYPAAWGG